MPSHTAIINSIVCRTSYKLVLLWFAQPSKRAMVHSFTLNKWTIATLIADSLVWHPRHLDLMREIFQ